MHGAHNDFVLLDLREQRVADLIAFAKKVCERRTGVGADGVLAVEPATDVDARMRVINADGSEAETCGNGLRCVARYLDDGREQLRIATGAGVAVAQILERSPEYVVRVAMGVASVRSTQPWVVDVGNPHLLHFEEDANEYDLESAALRAQAESAGGINVHVVQVVDERTLRMRHWERGVGFTQACGSGAVAGAVAAIASGRARSPLVVLVPGGRLEVEWDGVQAWLAGPAVRVFDATLDEPFAGG